MSLRDPRPPLRGPRAASLALDNLSKVASGLAPCLPQKSLGHTSAYFRNRTLSERGPRSGSIFFSLCRAISLFLNPDPDRRKPAHAIERNTLLQFLRCALRASRAARVPEGPRLGRGLALAARRPAAGPRRRPRAPGGSGRRSRRREALRPRREEALSGVAAG